MTSDDLEGSLCTASKHMVLLFHIQCAFRMTAGANALTYGNLKLLESLGIGKTRCIARFPCNNTVLSCMHL